MSENNPSNSMGDPEPFDANEAPKVLIDVVAVMVAIAGALVVIPALLMPTRTAGASHASRIRWQQRQCEVDQAIAAQAAGSTNANTNGPSAASEKR